MPSADRARVRVCFVCLGNICRSPTAEAVLRGLLAAEGLDAAVAVESAGTGGWHVGEPPDPRSRAAARARGVRLDGSAQQFTAEDFARFDLVLAMDRENERELLDLAPGPEARAKVALLRSFDPKADAPDVPDPYYGGGDGFGRVLDICESACRALLDRLVADHALRR